MKDNILKMLREKAAKKRRKVVIAEGWDERCLEAADQILKEDKVDLVLLDNGETKANAKKFGYDVSKAELVDFKNFEDMDKLVDELVKLRGHKGVSEQDAKRLLADENYFACTYVSCGYADALVGSKICSTAALMRPTLQILRKPGTLVSDIMVVYFEKKDKTYFITDGSMNIDPNSEELANIATNVAHVMKGMNIKPKVAFLSFSTYGSGGDNEKTKKVKEALKIAKEKMPDVLFDGEMQVDAATSEYASARKCPDSPLNGDANALVFPDLNSGNVFCHTIMQMAEVELISEIVAGLRKPVAILGRSTPTSFVVNMIYTVAMEANSDD